MDGEGLALLVASFLAGVLTVLAPCVLPLLPVIVGGSVVRDDEGRADAPSVRRAVVICVSLGASVVAFTLLLKATTSLLGVPQAVWSTLAGLIVLAFGVHLVRPGLWERVSARWSLNARSGAWLSRSRRRRGLPGDVLLGAALGPVFNSCSPTYLLIVATVLPASFAQGTAYVVVYALGLAGALLVLALAGGALVRRLGWLASPSGGFRRAVGALTIVVGAGVLVGLDRSLQAFILRQGWYDPIADFEQGLGL